MGNYAGWAENLKTLCLSMAANMLPSNPQSQTPIEQSDLVKYEFNLASCYEAEYLLSFKFQEETLGRRNEGDDSLPLSCMYLDDYEVVGTPNCCTDMEGVCTQQPRSMDTESLSNIPVQSSSIDSTTPTNLSDSSLAPEVMDCGIYFKCVTSHSEVNHLLSTPTSNSLPLCPSVDNKARSVSGSDYYEGPSRKRICLELDRES